jgi:hypothetical protein
MAAHFQYRTDIDMAENWPAFGMAELGILFGPPLFGFGLGLALHAIQRLAIAIGWRMPFIALCLLGVGYDVAVSVECSPITLIGSLRDLMLLSAPFLIFYPFLRPKVPRAIMAASAAGMAGVTEEEMEVHPTASVEWSGQQPVEQLW